MIVRFVYAVVASNVLEKHTPTPMRVRSSKKCGQRVRMKVSKLLCWLERVFSYRGPWAPLLGLLIGFMVAFGMVSAILLQFPLWVYVPLTTASLLCATLTMRQVSNTPEGSLVVMFASLCFPLTLAVLLLHLITIINKDNRDGKRGEDES